MTGGSIGTTTVAAPVQLPLGTMSQRPPFATYTTGPDGVGDGSAPGVADAAENTVACGGGGDADVHGTGGTGTGFTKGGTCIAQPPWKATHAAEPCPGGDGNDGIDVGRPGTTGGGAVGTPGTEGATHGVIAGHAGRHCGNALVPGAHAGAQKEPCHVGHTTSPTACACCRSTTTNTKLGFVLGMICFTGATSEPTSVVGPIVICGAAATDWGTGTDTLPPAATACWSCAPFWRNGGNTLMHCCGCAGCCAVVGPAAARSASIAPAKSAVDASTRRTGRRRAVVACLRMPPMLHAPAR